MSKNKTISHSCYTANTNNILASVIAIGTSFFIGTTTPFNLNTDEMRNKNNYTSFYISRIQDYDYDGNIFSNLTVNDHQSDTMSIELTENLAILHEFLELQDDWDGEGAKSFNRDLIDFLCGLIMDLEIQPDIFPLQDGKVVFEFGNVKSKYLEFSFNHDKHMDVYKKSSDGHRVKDINIAFSKERFDQEVNWFES